MEFTAAASVSSHKPVHFESSINEGYYNKHTSYNLKERERDRDRDRERETERERQRERDRERETERNEESIPHTYR